MTGPARGYKWADAGPGNTLALRHGARSPRVYGPVAGELAAGLLADRPDLEGFPETVAAWADAEARADLLRRWLDERGMFDADGVPRDGALRWLSAFDKRAADLRSRLGLDPRSEAELARDRAEATRSVVDLDSIRASGRAARLAAEARHAALPAGVDDDEHQDGCAAPASPGGSLGEPQFDEQEFGR